MVLSARGCKEVPPAPVPVASAMSNAPHSLPSGARPGLLSTSSPLFASTLSLLEEPCQ